MFQLTARCESDVIQYGNTSSILPNSRGDTFVQHVIIKSIAAIVLSAFIVSPGFAQPEIYAYPEAPSAGAIIGDLFLARPAGLIATAVGTAVFIVALPFSLPSRSVDTVAQALVVKPATFTFVRPLGEDIRSY